MQSETKKEKQSFPKLIRTIRLFSVFIVGIWGMYLQIQPNGSKYWRMNCRINRKQITLAFGEWPIVTLMEARRKQEEAKERIDKGINPIQGKREKGNYN